MSDPSDVAADHDALEALRVAYGRAYRLGTALAGERAGRGIARRSVGLALRHAGRDLDPSRLARTVLHSAVMLSRRVRVADGADLSAFGGDAQALAFARAVRALPRQQTEALILGRLERLDPRAVSTAMDCSQEASGTHLEEAERALRLISGADFGVRLAELQKRYDLLGPPDETRVEWVRGRLARHRVTLGLESAARLIGTVLLLAAIAVSAWWLIRRVEF